MTEKINDLKNTEEVLTEELLTNYKRKIEKEHNCKVFELPCFVNDIIFVPRLNEIRNGKEKYAIDTYKVIQINIYSKELVKFTVTPTNGNTVGNVFISEYGEKWFRSKNKAEERIKYLESC